MPHKLITITHESVYDGSKFYDGEWAAPIRREDDYYAVGRLCISRDYPDSLEFLIPPSERWSFQVNGTDLHISDREDCLGYIKLLQEVLKEFPDEG